MMQRAYFSDVLKLHFWVALISLMALPLRAHAEVLVNILQPQQGGLVGDSINIVATVSSDPYELAGTTAKSGDVEIPLTQGTQNNQAVWKGSLSLAGKPRGSYAFTVQGVDVKGNTGTAEGQVTKDSSPRLHFLFPSQEASTISQIRAAVTCTDDDPEGCSFLGVWVGGVGPLKMCNPGEAQCVDSPGVLKIDQLIDVTQYKPGRYEIFIHGEDKQGQGADYRIYFNVELAEALTTDTTVIGQILDVRTERILYKLTADPFTLQAGVPASNALVLIDRSTGQEATIKEIDQHLVSRAFLTPAGALYAIASPGTLGTLYEFRNGQLIDHNELKTFFSRGDYAYWETATEHILHNYATGQETSPELDAKAIEIKDMGPGGELLVEKQLNGSSSEIFLYKGGINTSIASGHLLPGILTDGTNVIYVQDEGETTHHIYHVTLKTPSSTDELAAINYPDVPAAGSWYQVNHGWAAYVAPGSTGKTMQVWLRNPEGVKKQVSFFAANATVDALSPNGDVTFKSGDGLFLTNFEAKTERKIASSHAQGLFQPEGLYVLFNNSLYRVQGTFQVQMGDVDGNGSIDVNDAVMTLGMIVGVREKTQDLINRADVNHDTNIDISDVVMILRVIVGLETGFPQ